MIRRGRSWVTVDIYDDQFDCILHEVLVRWEYDPNGGNEVIPYWFDYEVILYQGDPSEQEKEQIDMRLEEFDLEKIMTSEYD